MPRIEWRPALGGIDGPHFILMLDGKYVGHFYIDAEKGIDAEQLLEDIAQAYNDKETANEGR